jgi:AraC family transcriptional regulator
VSIRRRPNPLGPVLDLQLLDALRVRRFVNDTPRPPDWPAAAHDAVELAWVEQGSMCYRVGRADLEVTPGQVVVIPVGVEHRTRLRPGARARSVWLGARLLPSDADDHDWAPRLEPGLHPQPGRLLRLVAMLHDEAEALRPAYQLAAAALAETVAIELWRDAAPSRRAAALPRDPVIRAAVAELAARYTEPHSVAALAAQARMSRFAFGRKFRAETGQSPYQYLLRQRVEAAAALLRRRELSVTEVAFLVGFTDLSRFARAFRRRFGQSPAAWRAARFA